MLDSMKPSVEDCRTEIARLVAAANEGGESDSYGGKRQSTRVSEPLQLEMTSDPTKLHGGWPVSMHNISEGGFALWSKRKLEQKTVVYVREFMEDNSAPWLPARVTHCTVGIRGFLIGAAFVLD